MEQKIQNKIENPIMRRLEALRYIYECIQNNKEFNNMDVAKKYGISTNFFYFVSQAGIVKSGMGRTPKREWTPNVPPNIQLVKRLHKDELDYINEHTTTCKIKKARKQYTKKNPDERVKTMVVEHPVELPTNEVKTKYTHKTSTEKTKKKKELGLIRRFLKWIW